MLLVDQAALFHGLLLGLPPFVENVLVPPEVDIGRGDVAEALMVAAVVVILDKGVDGLPFS